MKVKFRTGFEVVLRTREIIVFNQRNKQNRIFKH